MTTPAPICATIAGTVWKIEVVAGDVVIAGQSVVILESMKMEIPIEAPGPGRVSRVLVSVGDVVDEGAPLIELI
jgi:acetyl-CoA carboxylase biotin carboxyl carrier protein